jgi:plasmid stabilization system protein ParE
MRFLLSSAVHDDLRAAIEYYHETAGEPVAADFYEEFLHYAALAAKTPKAFAIYMNDPDGTRRVNFRRFPYHFLFRQVDANTIRILVVCHDHRHPSYGLDRW